MAMVVQARTASTRKTAATWAATSAPSPRWPHMLGAGFNHFWHAETRHHGGDLLYIQGHSVTGHLRPRLPGRPADRGAVADSFRQEVAGKGLSSYPHPWLMPELLAVPHRLHGPGPADGDLPGALPEVPARARHGRHRKAQGLGLHGRRRDGRARVAGRHRRWRRASSLDNLVFVINCNLQRLDGPVRGNGKIVQELESVFRGAAGTSSSWSGARAGTSCWRATRAAS
jgi:pyruvate dehydrogenase E1 component